LVGNGATAWEYDVFPSTPSVLYNFNMVPKALWDEYNAGYCVEYFNGVKPTNGTDPATCDDLWSQMSHLITPLNWYDLYRAQLSTQMTEQEREVTVMVEGQEKKYKKGYTMSEYAPWLFKKNKLGKGAKSMVDTRVFSSDFVSEYVNNATLRTFFHITKGAPGWQQCGGIDYHYQQEGSLWIYSILKSAGIRMLFYAGDTDAMVPLAGTRKWIKDLGWQVTEKWRPWTTEKQVSGYIVRYEGLDFVTVKGVGHMAPQWARQPVQEMVTNWIGDKSL
jgi:carboxypeptidase C (cathepsin A)